MPEKSQFHLFSERRFSAYFFTQFLGAFNDNVYKNALIVLIAFVGAARSDADTTNLINLAAGLFILPFFLFSAFAGQLADKYEKSKLIQIIKLCEIFIMLAAVVAFAIDNLYISIGVLFLMGTQSAFFGPVKYGILPQYLSRDELIGGNGLVEMGTFLAILIGTIIGSKVAAIPVTGVNIVSIIIIVLAIFGYLVSRRLPVAKATTPDLIVNWNPFSETVRVIKLARENRTVFLSILGISWFWFLGATYLAQFPNYTTQVLGGNVNVYTTLLATFSIGIGLGSALCERLSGHKVEIGLVPFGSLGLTLFGLDIYFSTPTQPIGGSIGLMVFLGAEGSLRLLGDILFVGVFGGFYIVPLYALVQQRSKEQIRSRIIAANNIINALMMVLSAIVAIVFLSAGFSITTLFLLIALFNAVVALYIFSLVPEFFMRFLSWMLVHTIYRLKVSGLDHIPEKGAVVIVCNHVSFVDPLIVGGSVRRPVRFVMDYKIYKTPILNWIFRAAKTIPIASKKHNPEMLEKAFVAMEEALQNGEALCIFPEGQITRDGKMNTFREGVKVLTDGKQVPIVPAALGNLWGSMFSRSHSFRFPRKLFANITLAFDTPFSEGKEVDMSELKRKIAELRGEKL